MPDKAWKKRERNAAKLFNGVRPALSGINSKITGADAIRINKDGTIDNEFPLFVEVKLRKKHTVVTLYDETAAKAKKEKKTPVIILAEKNRPGFWIMCKAKDLQLIAKEMDVTEED